MVKKNITWLNIILWVVILAISMTVFISFIRGESGGLRYIPFNINIGGAGIGIGVTDRTQYIVVKEESIKNNINNLSIKWISGKLDILKSEDNRIKIVQLAGKDFPREELFTYSLKDDKLTINDKRGKGRNFNFGVVKKSNGSDLEVYLPEKEFNLIKLDVVSSDVFSEDLDSKDYTVNAVSGDINCSGKFSDIKIKTISGDIEIDTTEGERITIDTTSGGAHILGSFNQLTAKTVSGDISLLGSVREADLKTTSGDFSISSETMVKKFNSNAVSGNVTLIIPENQGFTLNYNKVSGRLESDFPFTINGNKHCYRDGSAQYSVKSVSGSLKIRKK